MKPESPLNRSYTQEFILSQLWSCQSGQLGQEEVRALLFAEPRIEGELSSSFIMILIAVECIIVSYLLFPILIICVFSFFLICLAKDNFNQSFKKSVFDLIDFSLLFTIV